MNFYLNPNLDQAHFINKQFYLDSNIFESSKKKIFAKNPLYLTHHSTFDLSSKFHPVSILPNFLDENFILYFENKSLSRILSNVCTHRAHLILDKPCHHNYLQCPYYGRKFNSEGYIENATGFELHKEYHQINEKLPVFDFFNWNGFHFLISYKIVIRDILGEFSDELNWYPFEELVPEPNFIKEFELDAHWALYVENYLEGFHIPFIHKGLAKEIRINDYKVELLPRAIIQTAIGNADVNTFYNFQNVPNEYNNLAAIYLWIYPNIMINFYPWGVSLNLIIPQTKEKTIIHYESYIFNSLDKKTGAGGDLGIVEMEDQHAILKVQQGLKSNSYSPGKISPVHELGVHHFQQLIFRDLEY